MSSGERPRASGAGGEPGEEGHAAGREEGGSLAGSGARSEGRSQAKQAECDGAAGQGEAARAEGLQRTDVHDTDLEQRDRREVDRKPGAQSASNMHKLVLVLPYVLLFWVALSLCWSIAYVGTELMFDRRPQRAAWQQVDADVQTFIGSQPATRDQAAQLLELLGRDSSKRFVLGDDSGPLLVQGSAPGSAAAWTPLHQDIARVLNGGIVRSFDRPYWISAGTAVSGTRVVIGDYAYALFVVMETPPLWRGVEVQLIAGFLGLLLMFGLAWLNGANRRRVDLLFMLTDAMRRMAKGDFNVTLPEPGPMSDELGGLVQGFNEMAVELGQMEKLRQEFISNVSHEIQSPLTSIRGFSRALMNDRLDPQERKQYLGIIEAESERLSKISDNLLKLSSLESAQPPFEPQRYRLDKQLRNLVLACEPQWVAKELELDIQLEEGTIAADQDLLSQVWTNLLHNSIKFTPQGGTLGVRLVFAEAWARVEIRDTGIGISEADQARIFERFYKADTARSSTGGGSGLGLSIVQKIVGLHGGSIGVESRLGEGTIFTVTLPVEAVLSRGAGGEGESGEDGIGGRSGEGAELRQAGR